MSVLLECRRSVRKWLEEGWEDGAAAEHCGPRVLLGGGVLNLAYKKWAVLEGKGLR